MLAGAHGRLARSDLPHAEVEVVPGLSHRAMPFTGAAGLDRRILRFLGED